MNRVGLGLILLLSLGAPAFAAEKPRAAVDWTAWQYLPVQDGGRHKPLDTLGWETLRTLSNRSQIAHPATGEKLSPTAAYLAMLFDWQGWDKAGDAPSPHGMGHSDPYFAHHEPDAWDKAPLLRVDDLQLRAALGMAADQKYIAPLALSQAKLRNPESGETQMFLLWTDRLAANRDDGHSRFEKQALDLAGKYWIYQDHRMGWRLEVVPVEGSKTAQWLPMAELARANLADASDPGGKLREVRRQFLAARAAYRKGSPQEFQRASAAFLASVGKAGPKLGAYPTAEHIRLEVAYNHWAPFRFAWVLAMIASAFALLSLGSRWRPVYWLTWLVFAASVVAMLIGFGMRIAISGRAPVSNMYESVIYVGLGIAVMGVILEIIYRSQYILTAAAVVSTLTLLLADNSPAVLDPSLHPLQPVLRSNFWLITHVMSITASYAAFALALGIGNITLGFYLVGSKRRDTIESLSLFTYRSLQVGVLLLAAGTILGGVWADYAWGRFWGWDPKEVWALIALLGYLAVLHVRFVGWVRHFGLAVLSILCFSLVVFAWYGVNYLLGAGLHSYGFGGGGQEYVFGALGVQFLYVAVAAVRYLLTSPGLRHPADWSGQAPSSLTVSGKA